MNADLTGVDVSAPVEKYRDDYIVVKDGADKMIQNGKRNGKKFPTVTADKGTKLPSRHPSVTRQQNQSHVSETMVPQRHSRSPTKNNNGQTPTAVAAYESETQSKTALAKARQFDIARRNKQSLQTLQVQKQMTSDAVNQLPTQEQKTRGMLKLIDSNASLALLDVDLKKISSTPCKVNNN